MRRTLALLLIALGARVAWGEIPRGHRTPRLAPSHVVVADATLESGNGVMASVKQGVPVRSASTGPLSTKGKIKVTLAGNVELPGQMDASLLGMRLARDVELRSPDGALVIGKARAGAYVRPLPGAAPAGQVVVETVGSIVGRAAVPVDALTAEPRELVFQGEWNLRTAQAVALVAEPGAQGGPRARLAEGTPLTYIEEFGPNAHVRTYGPFEIEGWVPLAGVTKRKGDEKLSAPAERIQPSHEIFVDAPFFAAPDARKPLGTLRGGTLVDAGTNAPGDLVKVQTLIDVVVVGWVKRSDLRALEAQVWSEPVR